MCCEGFDELADRRAEFAEILLSGSVGRSFVLNLMNHCHVGHLDPSIVSKIFMFEEDGREVTGNLPETDEDAVNRLSWATVSAQVLLNGKLRPSELGDMLRRPLFTMQKEENLNALFGPEASASELLYYNDRLVRDMLGRQVSQEEVSLASIDVASGVYKVNAHVNRILWLSEPDEKTVLFLDGRDGDDAALRWRDWLGLIHFKVSDEMVLLEFGPSSAFTEFHRPTTLDSGGNTRYRAINDDEAQRSGTAPVDQMGRALNLAALREASPVLNGGVEVVTENPEGDDLRKTADNRHKVGSISCAISADDQHELQLQYEESLRGGRKRAHLYIFVASMYD